jgi:UDP-glucose 4-epimerase
MKILMTGKTGLIGAAIYDRMIRDGHSVHFIGRRNSDFHMDLNYFKPIEDIDSCDCFIHCAGVTDEEIMKNKKQAIIRGTSETIALMDWVASLKPSKIIYVSTAHVYGDLNKPIDEGSATNPISLYGMLHLFCEQYVKNIGCHYLILRPLTGFGKVGRNFNRWGLIPYSFPRGLAVDKKIVIKTHGKQYRNFVSTLTIAEIVSKEIGQDGSKSVNPVGPHTMSILDFANLCIETLDPESKHEFELLVQQKADYTNYFNYSSAFKCPTENTDILKEHIVDIYNQFCFSKKN